MLLEKGPKKISPFSETKANFAVMDVGLKYSVSNECLDEWISPWSRSVGPNFCLIWPLRTGGIYATRQEGRGVLLNVINDRTSSKQTYDVFGLDMISLVGHINGRVETARQRTLTRLGIILARIHYGLVLCIELDAYWTTDRTRDNNIIRPETRIQCGQSCVNRDGGLQQGNASGHS